MSFLRHFLNLRFLRFLVTGTMNTAVTFGVYVALKRTLDYQIAYLLSYAFGILFAYFMSALFVFKKRVSIKTFIWFPLIYLVQYALGAMLLGFLVRVLGLSATFAPLFVIVVTLPLSFLLSRFVLLKS
ncbi:GtrA family protein [Glaciimonas sp. PAMC28666]|uniref:GtrA family protein n=1 Tax=Glaciimonas sp. PAMC28666 TaxID=2807626 RepID=UPI0019660A92|nr:GtrA family protein [Glaciimonas sp. PAMC28666]